MRQKIYTLCNGQTLNIYFLTFICIILNLQGCKQENSFIQQMRAFDRWDEMKHRNEFKHRIEMKHQNTM